MVLAIYVGVMKMMNKEVAEYINSLLSERETLMEERKQDTNQWQSIPELYSDLKKDTEWELGMIYQAQKSMDYIIEEDN